MKYRGEIDGLRALAVVPVILFHAGFSWFPGGFVGVDVFFVISGFLITTIIINDIENGKFTIVDFYERRARRILPALILVMLCTLPFAWMWMPPSKLREYASSLTAVAAFYSNFQFWSEGGYFAAAAVEKPLLHTWSLAIEEQFYVLYPLLMGLMWPARRQMLTIAIAFAALASLGLAIWGIPDDPDANFYLLPSRAWELLAGSVLALADYETHVCHRVSAIANQFLSAGGLLAILVSIFFCNVSMQFPGNWTLLPVTGTCLLLGFARSGTVAGAVLSQPWIVKLGLVSYSAYLWHQPLFAFARLRSLDAPAPLLFTALSVSSLGLAFLSWRFVETPFRRRDLFGRPQIFASGAIAAAGLAAIGAVGSQTEIAYSPYFASQLAAIEPAESTKDDCNWRNEVLGFPKIKTCRFGGAGGEAPVVLIGDSHAGALMGELGDRLRARGIPGVFLRNGHCRVITGIYMKDQTSSRTVNTCQDSNAAFLNYVDGLKPRVIVIAIRWTFQLSPIEGSIDQPGFDNGEGGIEEEPPRQHVARDPGGAFVTGGEAKARAVRDFVIDFAKLNVPIVIQYPVPEVGWNVPDLNFKHLISEGKIPETISTDERRFKNRHAFITGVLDQLVDGQAIIAVRPEAILCGLTYRTAVQQWGQVHGNQYTRRCLAQRKGIPLYFDDDHLSREGSIGVVTEIIQHIP